MSIFTNDFSQELWQHKYKWKTDNNIKDMWWRVAKDLASVEEDPDKWAEEFYSILSDFKFIPGGRILSNAGTNLKGTSYINCFTDSFDGEDQDSIEGIYSALLRQAQILKSEGGYGFCCDVMRPRGTHISGIGNQTPGAVKFLELWDKSSEIITAGSGKENSKEEKQSIRKGAQLVSMSCWHPDIVEFITAKQTPGRLTKFNMSVLCTDDFMRAVINDEPWDLVYPNIKAYKKEYKKYWNGNLDEWHHVIDTLEKHTVKQQYAVIFHKHFDSARELWDLIMESTYNRNEPGVLFVDTINRMNNLHYCEHISASNPCGEQPLDRGVCLLGSINLTQFIDPEKQDWKYEELEQTITTAVRLMDNVNDVTYVTLDAHKQSLKDKRRIGLGVIGYASALMMARVKYGSKKALRLTEQLMEFFTNKAYQASTFLSKEKGSFLLYDESMYLSGEFVKQLSERTLMMIKQDGMRNSHCTSIQPTGNTAVLANLISSGLEPIFATGYYRTAIVHEVPEGMELPEHIDWDNGTGDIKDWKWHKQGDENILVLLPNHEKYTFNATYIFDRNRGLCKEQWVEDYAITWLKERGMWDETADWATTAMDLSIDDHIKTMKIFANWVDAAISKTINLPNDYSYEDFKEVYIDAWRSGIKGITTYRVGTMTTVLSESSALDVEDRISKTTAPKRPKELECDVHHTSVKGKQYFVLVGLYKGDPYEVFAGINGHMDKKNKKGTIIKVRRNKYKCVLEDGDDFCPINFSCDEHEDAVTRLTSTSLRHGADVQFVVRQLEKNVGDLQSFSKAIARALKKYIPDGTKEQGLCPECEKESLIRQEGCVLCASCGYSKCV